MTVHLSYEMQLVAHFSLHPPSSSVERSPWYSRFIGKFAFTLSQNVAVYENLGFQFGEWAVEMNDVQNVVDLRIPWDRALSAFDCAKPASHVKRPLTAPQGKCLQQGLRPLYLAKPVWIAPTNALKRSSKMSK